MLFNLALTVVAFVVVGVVAYFVLGKSRVGSSDYIPDANIMTFTRLLDLVKEEISELVKDDTFFGTSEEAFRNALSRKAKIVTSLREATDGMDNAKEVVTDIIYNLVCKHCPTEAELCSVVPFQSNRLSAPLKFEILMYHIKRQLIAENAKKPKDERKRSPERAAFTVWMKRYGLDAPKYLVEDGEKASYVITEEEVEQTFEAENIELHYADMAKIVSILIFQRYKGFGCIDTVRACDINGMTIGTSGSILTYLREQKFTSTRSVWVNSSGKYIHLRFLDFGTSDELRRVVQLLSRYNSPGPLTERRGYIINNMYDESRVVAIRPPFAESWGAFIRKFGADHKTLRFLLYKDYIKNWELPYKMIQFLMMGQVTTAFTGRQGSGKTVMMTSAIEFMDPRHNLRIIEMAFEMNVREHYPERNVMTFQETEYIDAGQAQDVQKKTDGAVSLFGEVATDEVANRMIQTGRVASLFTIFSHHGKTAADTVHALADSVVAASGTSDRSVAEKQVIDVLRIDVHLDNTADGKYYVERITEILKLPEGVPYPEIDENNIELSRAEMEREYYSRSTDRQTFITRDIIRYDLDTDTYYSVSPPSYELWQEMLDCMAKEQRDAFTSFLSKNFDVMPGKTNSETAFMMGKSDGLMKQSKPKEEVTAPVVKMAKSKTFSREQLIKGGVT